MISISTGDIMHVMGGFGLQMDYTVRMTPSEPMVYDIEPLLLSVSESGGSMSQSHKYRGCTWIQNYYMKLRSSAATEKNRHKEKEAS